MRVNSASKRHTGIAFRITFGLSIAYLLALLTAAAALRLVGEQWWITTVALYVPRAVFAIPMLPLLTASICLRSRRLLACQAAAVFVVMMLAGFHLSWPRHSTPGAFTFRLATCNMDTGNIAVEEIVNELRRRGADVIILQEAHPNIYARLAAASAGYSILAHDQFWIASRFPVDEIIEPAKLPFNEQLRSPRFIRYRIRTPRGPFVLYNVHFISPRDGIEELRGAGFRHELERGNFPSGRSQRVIDGNTALRELQMQAVAHDAERAPYPTIIAGDTNLPGLSRALPHWFARYQDGFSAAGEGFGYTFPAPRHPWMRIDRILADRVFRFISFDVVRKPLSDHFPVIAQVEWPDS